MKNVNVSLQIIPVVPEEEIYPVVDKVIDMIKEKGVIYVVGPMETTMEGDYEVLMNIVKEAQEICYDLGADRVLAVVKIDSKKNGVTIDEKIYKYR
ncbi:thiamine-binding protein [Alkalibacter mobilis]|uniref:thiamine-binding protein n=1 Tax=Alkalibacter mobilis TaxID=2787712 RepID=UPI00189FC277|nr:thiamine-binding protein [Alkalibacter mobilis]MBF7097153.1 thiamine-binding protein [Alkalibacter mobilis]